MLTPKCTSTGSRIQLRSGITRSVLFLLNEERRVLLDIRSSLTPQLSISGPKLAMHSELRLMT
jgi:hypothetical protein